jgi:ADP-heptose:LPS heptosyltransferase
MQDKKIKKILLAHLNSNGDCLYSTVIAKQIKEVDYPNAHLTWAVNSKCAQTILFNPNVDEIWEIPTKATLTTQEEWNAFVEIAEKRKALGEFDIIFYTQIFGANFLNFDGGIRSSTYHNYPHKITVSQQPIINLSIDEVETVKSFANKHNLQNFKNVILIECGPESFASALNPTSAREIAYKLTKEDTSLAIILSSTKKIENTNAQIIDASTLSFRANAELTKYCTLFVGCSSGISWLCTTNWAKPLQKVIIVNHNNYYNNSMVDDHIHANLPIDCIIELKENANTVPELLKCLSVILYNSFEKSKDIFHTNFKLTNFKFLDDILYLNKHKGNHQALFKIVGNIIRRNGWRKRIIIGFLGYFFSLPKYYFKYKKK